MSDFFDVLSSHWYVSAPLVGLVLTFIAFFVAPSFLVARHLSRFGDQVVQLRKSRADPKQLSIRDERLKHLWDEYCETLHLPHAAINPRTGLAHGVLHRATVPAELIFNSQSVFEGRINTEFFKHLPGLLTGIGIIGTFLGLIDGLGQASTQGKLPETDKLIASVRDAFNISAAAIILAMVVTFFEKIIVSRLHGRIEKLCQNIDSLYSAGAGEEYLARLVSASEDSVSQAKILKDALVGDLREILEQLAQKQIAAGAAQQAALQQNLVAAIDQGLRQPLGDIAQGFGTMRSQQGETLTQSLQDSMSAFAVKLDQILGGQVSQAKDLQVETLRSLDTAVKAFQSMATEVGTAGQNATSAMTTQLASALDDMVRRQGEMNGTLRAFVDELRGAITDTQREASGGLGRIVQDLSAHVEAVVGSLRADAKTATEVQGRHAEQFSEQARETITKLTSEVGGQTAAIREATAAMRGAVAELSSSVDRNIGRMSEGATEMHRAAEQFTGSGKAISDVFERSATLSMELTRAASALSGATQDVQTIVHDYQSARETFRTVVDTLQQTVETAKRDASMTSDLTTRLQRAAEKLVEAQGRADEYLTHLNGALVEAHTLFSNQMLETVRKTNANAHEHLANSTKLLASTIADLDGTIVDFRRDARSAG